MTPALDEHWAILKQRYPRITDTGILAGLITQEATGERTGVELDPMSLTDLEFLRIKMSERSGRDLTYAAVIREIARDKAAEYDAKQNNAARITHIVERLTALEVAVKALIEQSDRSILASLDQSIKELLSSMRGQAHESSI
jgi:hypothetical protein